MGVIETEHGTIETPTLVPVATQATVKTLTSQEAIETGCQILICNTFHLHLKPGEKIVKINGGLHEFMNWPRPLMTDSGGFQVFSLGFGRDFKIGKVISDSSRRDKKIGSSDQSRNVKITEKGVFFNSPVDGAKLFIGPRESIRIQEDLGADIIFAFDECTPPQGTKEYAKNSMELTHRWAKICLEARRTKQALFGIVQGSHFKDLRRQSATAINEMGFDGFGIGGDLGISKKAITCTLNWTLPFLDESKPRHLLGIGKLEDIPMIIKNGVDLFDCTVPTHYARHGIAFIDKDKLDLNKTIFLRDKKPLLAGCRCFTCQNHSRAYVCHLLRAKELTALKLLTTHNLFFFNSIVKKIRDEIRERKL